MLEEYIETILNSGGEELDLILQNLTLIPNILLKNDLSKIKTLYEIHNNIINLTKLKKLKVNNIGLIEIPEEFIKLTELCLFELNNNELIEPFDLWYINIKQPKYIFEYDSNKHNLKKQIQKLPHSFFQKEFGIENAQFIKIF